MSQIKKIKARKIEDSRGNPTIEVDVITGNGLARAAAPSGASTGDAEVVAFPKNKGVDSCIDYVNNNLTELIGTKPDLLAADELLHNLDKNTDDFSNIGCGFHGGCKISSTQQKHSLMEILKRNFK